MAALYEIQKEILACFREGDAVVNGDTGEVFDADYLTNLEMDKVQKVENIACFIKDLESDAVAIEAEESALSARRKVLRRKADQLRAYLEATIPGEKIDTARCSVRWRRAKSVEVSADPKTLPDEYVRIKFSFEPKKADIKAALSAGASIPGCALVERQSVQIK